MANSDSDIQIVLAEMQRSNELTANLVAAQLVTQTAQVQIALDTHKAAGYAEQRLAVERGFFLDVGALLQEVREQNQLMRTVLMQTPLSESLAEFTEQAEQAIRHINYRLETVLRFMQSAIPHMGTMAKDEREILHQKLRDAVHAPRLDSLMAQYRDWQASLHTIQEQEALYAGTPPIELSNRLTRAQEKLARLDEEIKALRDE